MIVSKDEELILQLEGWALVESKLTDRVYMVHTSGYTTETCQSGFVRDNRCSKCRQKVPDGLLLLVMACCS
jgi:hypothetical protein